MALSSTRKKDMVRELKEKLDGSELCFLADPIGMTVAEVSELRKKLRENGVDFKIYKNTLIKKAIEEKGDEGLKQLYPHLKGPTGVAVTEGDPIKAAKIFTDFASENQKLGIKAAVFQGDYWDEGRTKEMAKLESMASIYGRLVRALKAPVSKLVNTINGPATRMVLTLKAAAEKGDK